MEPTRSIAEDGSLPASISEDAIRNLKEEFMRKTQEEFVANFTEYMDHGTMPHSFYMTLPPKLQRKYRDRFRHLPNHIHGRPQTNEEKGFAVKAKRKKDKKRRAAKKARKRSR